MFIYEVKKSEIVRYLGYRRGFTPDETIYGMIDECLEDMKKAVTPREIHKCFRILRDDGVRIGEMKIEEGNLTKNLAGCEEAVLMAVTLGPEPDRLVRRAELGNMNKAFIYQAIGAAMTEVWCDEVNIKVRKESAERGLYTRPRFSPGYGDFPLEHQKDFARILNMTREIGVTLSDSLLMIPSKSVTAVIGLSTTEDNCRLEGCEVCSRHGSCAFSRI